MSSSVHFSVHQYRNDQGFFGSLSVNIFIDLTLLYNVLIGQNSFIGLLHFIGTVWLCRVCSILSHVPSIQFNTEGSWAEVPALGRPAAIVEFIVCPLLALH